MTSVIAEVDELKGSIAENESGEVGIITDRKFAYYGFTTAGGNAFRLTWYGFQLGKFRPNILEATQPLIKDSDKKLAAENFGGEWTSEEPVILAKPSQWGLVAKGLFLKPEMEK